MDTYSKGIFTVIAVLLAIIAVGVWLPYIESRSEGHQPTLGDMFRLREIKDPDVQKRTRLELIHSIPYVEVYGTVDVQ